MGWLIEQLEARGYAATRYGYLMLRDLAEPIADDDLPDGLTSRHGTPDDLQAIWRDSTRLLPITGIMWRHRSATTSTGWPADESILAPVLWYGTGTRSPAWDDQLHAAEATGRSG